MDKTPKAFAGAMQVAGALDPITQIREDWRLARAAQVDLRSMGMPRVNLLLIGQDGVVRHVLESLLLDLSEPILHWCAGEQLVLPPAARVGTMILHDVHDMPLRDQHRLLRWLEVASGHTQIISTTFASLLPRIQAGKFNDTLYYRLNTVCLDVND